MGGGEPRTNVPEPHGLLAGHSINRRAGRLEGFLLRIVCRDSTVSSSGTLLRAASDEIFKIFFSAKSGVPQVGFVPAPPRASAVKRAADRHDGGIRV
jgi:hypothetical protein